MAAPASLNDLRKDRKLAHYVLKGRALGRQVGSGAYGSVEEVSPTIIRRDKLLVYRRRVFPFCMGGRSLFELDAEVEDTVI